MSGLIIPVEGAVNAAGQFARETHSNRFRYSFPNHVKTVDSFSAALSALQVALFTEARLLREMPQPFPASIGDAPKAVSKAALMVQHAARAAAAAYVQIDTDTLTLRRAGMELPPTTCVRLQNYADEFVQMVKLLVTALRGANAEQITLDDHANLLPGLYLIVDSLRDDGKAATSLSQLIDTAYTNLTPKKGRKPLSAAQEKAAAMARQGQASGLILTAGVRLRLAARTLKPAVDSVMAAQTTLRTANRGSR